VIHRKIQLAFFNLPLIGIYIEVLFIATKLKKNLALKEVGGVYIWKDSNIMSTRWFVYDRDSANRIGRQLANE